MSTNKYEVKTRNAGKTPSDSQKRLWPRSERSRPPRYRIQPRELLRRSVAILLGGYHERSKAYRTI